MAIVSNTVDYLDGDAVLEGFFAYDDALDGRRPAVLISHAWGGRDEFVADKAKKLAELGYVGFALDIYGKGKRGNSIEENSQLMQPFMDDRAMLQRRIAAALSAVKLLPWVDDQMIAAIGFCFGGLCVLDLARTGADLKGVASFHGLLIPPGNLVATDIKAKVLVMHGNDDPMAPVDHVVALEKELTDAGADWQIHVYGNTVHAFTNPLANDPGFGTVYNSLADNRSWKSLLAFLQEAFAR
ncbi:dienelactone hydrolase family protein [Methylotuvimicrobium buryatense]|uniref:Dienelactone hydrolase family protein n=1 Tax=Methylotuvimicrobium buryatense TaxID=95641 RepID=A0A4V1IJT5_METBY|nr:dienelactone hydrolase family protein [Methylotuvimicrobium buryatense]QCW82525.1 dienelactone hydrolase family protein [Methylotuvimicrobium buryatense]